MKKPLIRVGRLWCAGAILLVLRTLQIQTGFDAVTGLSIPSLPGTAVLVLLLASAVLESYLYLRTPSRKTSFSKVFTPPEKELPAAIIGSFLLAAGGVLLAWNAFSQNNLAAGAAGILAAVAGAGIVLFFKQVRAEEEISVLPLLPLMFFSVFFVLSVYLPLENDPVFARYYLPILTSAMIAYSSSQLAGFCRKDSDLRAFLFTADLTVILCIASAAESGLAAALLFLGCALLLSVFLILRREVEEIPDEPPKNQKKAKPKKSKA